MLNVDKRENDIVEGEGPEEGGTPEHCRNDDAG